jgi:hypothetical protein
LITRYAIISGLIVAVALAAGLVVHLVAGSTKYIASCEFQVALPSTSTVPSSDILVFNRRQAADELARAQLERVWEAVAKETGVSAGTVAAGEKVVQASDSSFRVAATTTDAGSAPKVANALCRQYVSQLTSQVHDEQSNEIDGLRSQIASLERQLGKLKPSGPAGFSPAQQVERSAIINAIARSRDILTASLSLPPDNISLLSPAAGAAPNSTKPTLSKALIVAAAAGLLASFLLILVIEAVRGRETEETRPGDERTQQEGR